MEQPSAQVKLMSSPLVAWVTLFRKHITRRSSVIPDNADDCTLSFEELCQGSFLKDVMHQIHARSLEDKLITHGARIGGSMERLQNWTSLLKTIKAFYKEELNQILTMRLPDVIRISKDPDDEAVCRDMKATLLLLLGCAIQCDRKEFFIQQIITELSEAEQLSIKDCITEITENMENVFSLETPVEKLGVAGKALYYHLTQVLEERDNYIEEAAQATVDSEVYYNELEDLRSRAAPLPSSPEKHHIGVELAECKAKVRRLRGELEEKADLTTDMKEELEDQRATIAKLRDENKSLTVDARSARAYRDELDIVREKARKVDKLEKTIQSYKDRMHELDFFKSRVDELREENKSLIEMKVMLEDQLASSVTRNETIIDLENELMAKRREVEELTSSYEREQDYIREMQEYVHKLECDKNSTLNESASLEEELAGLKGLSKPEMSLSLKDQLNSSSTTEVLKLELEVKRLHKVICDMKEQALIESNTHAMELEKENRRLSAKVEKLQESSTKAGQENMEIEQERQGLMRQVAELGKALDTVRESSERQVNELEQENEQLNEKIDSLKKRNDQTLDTRNKEVERENERMAEIVQERNHQVSKLEYELKSLQRSLDQLQSQSDEQTEKTESTNSELNRQLQTLRLTLEKYEHAEQELADRDLELKKQQKQIANFKSKLTSFDEVSQENISLTVDVQRLQKSLTACKESANRVADVEQELEENLKEIGHLQKSIRNLELDRSKLHDLEVKLYSAESENLKLQKQIELNSRKLEAKLSDFEEVQTDNKKLEETLEKLRLDNRKLQRLGEENASLEDSNCSLAQERDAKDKEVRRLRQTLELKDKAIEECTAKLELIERESKQLRRSGDKWRQASLRVKEHEKQTSELISQSLVDKKTLNTLREELVTEKIRAQQLSNELEQLKSELHKIGLDKDKLQANASVAEEERLKVLHDMMEETQKRSLQIKEDQIRVLESNLGDSKSLCATLNRQLDSMQKEYQTFLDRHKQESSVTSTTINVSPGKPQSSISQLVIKKTPQGQLISNERFASVQNELISSQKRNATLTSENAGLKSQFNYIKEMMKKLEDQSNSLKSETEAVTLEKNSLHAQLAQLQVENTTLSSQATTLHKQNTSLKVQLARLQANFDEIAVSHQELNETYDSLVTDHEQLQTLNEQLSVEYEALISDHGLLKTQHKQLREDSQEVERRKRTLSKEKAAIEEMRQSVHKERLSRQFDEQSFEDIKRVAEDRQLIQQQAEKLRGEYRDLLSEYKSVKTEYNHLKLKHTELKGDMADCRDQLNKLDIRAAKLSNKNEALEQQNFKLEEENRQLIYQLQALLQQNQELLTQTLESSEHFREEEDRYRDQLHTLRRTKEKLEEKIMDQYKSNSKQKRKGGIGGIFKKAQGFISKKTRERERARRKTVANINFTELSGRPDQPMRHSEGKLRLDGNKSQQDIPGMINQSSYDDTKSLGGYSLESHGSVHSQESSGIDQDGITLTKSNKVKIRRSRMKAQSIENLFEAKESPHTQTSFTPVDLDLGSPPVKHSYDHSQSDAAFNSVFNTKLTTDHRHLAVSSSAINMPVSINTLREISMTIPVADPANRNPGARSSNDISASSTHHQTRMSSDSSDTTSSIATPRPHRKVSSTRKKQWLRSSSLEEDLDDIDALRRETLRKGMPDELPTKDVGHRPDPKSSSATRMFYTPSSARSKTLTRSLDDSDDAVSVKSRTSDHSASSHTSHRSSPKPDVLMGAEYTQRQDTSPSNFPRSGGYGQMKTSKSQPSHLSGTSDRRPIKKRFE